MSNPNFVSDLVAMAKAFEELPSIKAELEAAKHDVQVGLERIQSLELRLIDRSNEIDSLNSTVRKVEVERDHAERMFLEADDAKLAAVRAMRHIIDEANGLIQIIQPAVEVTAEPKPEPEQVTEALTVGAEAGGQREVDPTTATTLDSNDSPTLGSSASAVDQSSTDAAPEVAAAPDPTPATESSSENVSSDSAQPETDARAESAVDPTTVPTVTFDAGLVGFSNAVIAESVSTEVGYHNEPKIGPGGGAEAWAEWDVWCQRMNQQHPQGWPPRPTVTTALMPPLAAQ